jgi:hypothetical protein
LYFRSSCSVAFSWLEQGKMNDFGSKREALLEVRGDTDLDTRATEIDLVRSAVTTSTVASTATAVIVTRTETTPEGGTGELQSLLRAPAARRYPRVAREGFFSG